MLIVHRYTLRLPRKHLALMGALAPELTLRHAVSCNQGPEPVRRLLTAPT